MNGEMGLLVIEGRSLDSLVFIRCTAESLMGRVTNEAYWDPVALYFLFSFLGAVWVFFFF